MNAIDGFLDKLGELEVLGKEVAEIQKQTTDQETEMLDRIVQKLLPVMRFIDYKIKVHGFRPGHQFGKWEYQYYEEKALILVEDTREKMTGGDTRGEYEGKFLVLTRSGKWIEFEKSGEWSRWQDESSSFESEPEEIDSRKAIERYGFADIMKGLNEDFKSAVEKAEKKKLQLGSRMEQLQQIEEILK